MTLYQTFDQLESSTSKNFIEQGFLIRECENHDGLNKIKEIAVQLIQEFTNNIDDIDKLELDNIHNIVDIKNINDLRIYLYSKLNSYNWFKPTYFSLARTLIEEIIGRELVIQNRINLNIMMPGDEGSNIHPHFDPHSGESPFQCVLWIPLTNCYDTKSICILPPEANREALKHFKRWMEDGGREKVFREVEDKLVWAEVPYGSCLLFSSTLFHGSVVNNTNETRWSFNTRFKALFSPYGSQEKGLGSFYLPIRTAPATHFGLQYTLPAGLEEV